MDAMQDAITLGHQIRLVSSVDIQGPALVVVQVVSSVKLGIMIAYRVEGSYNYQNCCHGSKNSR